MKKVFITGAAGFIGGYVVKEFVGQGWHVIAMVHRNNSPELEALARSGSVTILRGDAADLNSLQKAALAAAEGGAPEAVVHCAGRASDVGRDIEFRRANFEPVKNLTELALELNLGRLVFISTTDVYGMRDFNHETEEQLPAADNTGNSYPAYKIAAEDWLRAHLPPERFAIIRPAAVWGKGDRTFAPRILAYLKNAPCIVHFGKWGGRNRWPLAHVRNVAAAAFLAATRPEAAGAAVNVIDSEITGADEFYRILARVYLPGREFKSITLPFWTGQLLGQLITWLSDLLNLKRPFMDPSLYALYSANCNLDFDNARLLALFKAGGRSLVTRAEGIAELR